jgi:hypothetical protein
MTRELEMSLELLGSHVWSGSVKLLRTVQAADARQPYILGTRWSVIDGYRKLSHGIERPVFHDGLEAVTLIILLLEILEG